MRPARFERAWLLYHLKEQCGGGGQNDCSTADGAVRPKSAPSYCASIQLGSVSWARPGDLQAVQ